MLLRQKLFSLQKKKINFGHFGEKFEKMLHFFQKKVTSQKLHFSSFFKEACIGPRTTMRVSKRILNVQKTFWDKF